MVVGEGVKDALRSMKLRRTKPADSFGHPVYPEGGETKSRGCPWQTESADSHGEAELRAACAAHYASQTDIDEAVACGVAAVKAAVEGKSGFMVTLERASKKQYEFCSLHTLGDIALVERTIPDDWISEDGWLPNQQFIDYVAPLIEGDKNVSTGATCYISLSSTRYPSTRSYRRATSAHCRGCIPLPPSRRDCGEPTGVFLDEPSHPGSGVAVDVSRGRCPGRAASACSPRVSHVRTDRVGFTCLPRTCGRSPVAAPRSYSGFC